MNKPRSHPHAVAYAIERRIYLIRGNKVMLDRDLAPLYGVKPIALRQQVKRNLRRFPPDFMFRLSRREAEALVSRNVIPSKRSLGGYLPYAFTEQGVATVGARPSNEEAKNTIGAFPASRPGGNDRAADFSDSGEEGDARSGPGWAIRGGDRAAERAGETKPKALSC